MNVKIGDILYYARAFTVAGIFEVVQYEVISVKSRYFSCMDKDHNVMVFYPTDIDKHLFHSFEEAQEAVNQRKKEK